MAKVGAKIGFTLKLSKESQFEFIRPEIEISEIDTEGNVKIQLDLAEAALKETWNKVTDISSEEILSHMRDVDQELQLQLQKKFRKIDAEIDALKTQLFEFDKKTEKKIIRDNK